VEADWSSRAVCYRVMWIRLRNGADTDSRRNDRQKNWSRFAARLNSLLKKVTARVNRSKTIPRRLKPGSF
jgi:hypothetical protein